MGTSTEDLPSAPTSQRSPRDRSHGHERELEATPFHIPPPSPPSVGPQCSSLGLEPVVPDLHFPPEVAHSSSHVQTSNLQTPRPDSSTVVPSGTLVPIHPQQVPRPLDSEPVGPNEKWTSRLRELDRIPFLKEVFSAKWGAAVASRLITAHRTSTARQAQSVWNAFKRWLPPTLTTISSQTLMEFLIHCEDNRHLDPRTILNYRSQLTLPMLHAFDINLSTDTFSLLARSQFLRNPPLKQKIPQWSIDRILDTFSSPDFEIELASPVNLFLKTLFLTALASGNRASELSASVRTGLSLTDAKAVLPTHPSFLFKNQNPQNPTPPDITFPAIGNAHSLCPVTALRKYLAATQTLPHEDFVFIHPKSSKPLKAGRLSYWLAQAIKIGDPQAIRPAGHDIRKVGHSIAAFRNSTPRSILENGFWHNASVFVQKYLISCRPTTTSFVAGRSTTSS